MARGRGAEFMFRDFDIRPDFQWPSLYTSPAHGFEYPPIKTHHSESVVESRLTRRCTSAQQLQIDLFRIFLRQLVLTRPCSKETKRALETAHFLIVIRYRDVGAFEGPVRESEMEQKPKFEKFADYQYYSRYNIGFYRLTVVVLLAELARQQQTRLATVNAYDRMEQYLLFMSQRMSSYFAVEYFVRGPSVPKATCVSIYQSFLCNIPSPHCDGKQRHLHAAQCLSKYSEDELLRDDLELISFANVHLSSILSTAAAKFASTVTNVHGETVAQLIGEYDPIHSNAAPCHILRDILRCVSYCNRNSAFFKDAVHRKLRHTLYFMLEALSSLTSTSNDESYILECESWALACTAAMVVLYSGVRPIPYDITTIDRDNQPKIYMTHEVCRRGAFKRLNDDKLAEYKESLRNKLNLFNTLPMTRRPHRLLYSLCEWPELTHLFVRPKSFGRHNVKRLQKYYSWYFLQCCLAFPSPSSSSFIESDDSLYQRNENKNGMLQGVRDLYMRNRISPDAMAFALAVRIEFLSHCSSYDNNIVMLCELWFELCRVLGCIGYEPKNNNHPDLSNDNDDIEDDNNIRITGSSYTNRTFKFTRYVLCQCTSPSNCHNDQVNCDKDSRMQCSDCIRLYGKNRRMIRRSYGTHEMPWHLHCRKYWNELYFSRRMKKYSVSNHFNDVLRAKLSSSTSSYGLPLKLPRLINLSPRGRVPLHRYHPNYRGSSVDLSTAKLDLEYCWWTVDEDEDEIEDVDNQYQEKDVESSDDDMSFEGESSSDDENDSKDQRGDSYDSASMLHSYNYRDTLEATVKLTPLDRHLRRLSNLLKYDYRRNVHKEHLLPDLNSGPSGPVSDRIKLLCYKVVVCCHMNDTTRHSFVGDSILYLASQSTTSASKITKKRTSAGAIAALRWLTFVGGLDVCSIIENEILKMSGEKEDDNADEINDAKISNGIKSVIFTKLW